MVVALWGVLRHSQPVDLELDGERRKVWMIFIGNCRYEPSGFTPSWRERLDDGELDIRIIDTLCITSYDEFRQSALTILKSAAAADSGKDWLIIDDLVDTGRTAQEVRRLLPEAHFATVYAKPMGRPLVDTFVTEVSQDTWIFFPWDTGLAFVPPIREGG